MRTDVIKLMGASPDSADVPTSTVTQIMCNYIPHWQVTFNMLLQKQNILFLAILAETAAMFVHFVVSWH
jgi:hypothetical protein